MKKITHLEIFNIQKHGVFDNVNSYTEMNSAIKKYGKNSPDDYNNRVGNAFEIFTQFFCNKYGETPLLSIKNVMDTSDDPFTMGFDFNYHDLDDKMGQIQSKWRNDPNYQFKIQDLATNGEMARNWEISKDNNVLFINFDDREELFHYTFRKAREFRRVVGRNAQEEYILRDTEFWNEFRENITESCVNEFIEPFTPRDVQDWMMDGVEKDGEVYEGTISVLNGKYSKGRIEANTGAGKTLCQFYNIDQSFKEFNKNLCVMVLPTLSLITQTFGEFYKWGMFGTEEEGSNKVSCLIIRSGANPRYNSQIANVFQTLSVTESVEFIKNETERGQKVVIFTTMKSQDLKYSDIVDKLNENGIRINLELIDEYHNIISASSSREKQEEIASYLENNTERCDGTIFYSASNKSGQILDSFNEDQFGKLLCKVNRNDLRERAYVCPKLTFKFVKIPSFNMVREETRDGERQGLDMKRALSEAAGIISSFKDLKNYYGEPNLITFGSHVDGCKYLSEEKKYHQLLPGVNQHFMAAETASNDRETIIEGIRNSGNNILHQHSVAKEGVNIPNLHGSVIGRDLNIISLQQAIGRSDRALYEDTIKFNNGEITLDNPEGWVKFSNVIYILVNDNDSFIERVKKVVEFLLMTGIPEDQWDIQTIDDEERTGVEDQMDDSMTTITSDLTFNSERVRKLIEEAKIEVYEYIRKMENLESKRLENSRLNGMSTIEFFTEMKEWGKISEKNNRE